MNKVPVQMYINLGRQFTKRRDVEIESLQLLAHLRNDIKNSASFANSSQLYGTIICYPNLTKDII